MAEPPGQYSREKMGLAPSLGNPAAQFLENENLGSLSPSSSGQTAQDQNYNLWLTREDSGNLRGVDTTGYGATDEPGYLLPEIAKTQKDMQNENALAYAVMTDNTSMLSLAVDKKGFTQNFLSGAAVYGDTRNWAINAANTNWSLAQAWYAQSPSSRGNMSIPEAARAFLESSGVKMDGKSIMEAALKAGSGGGGGGGGRISTVSEVKKTNEQDLRAQANPIASQTIGRTFGVGEAEKMSKELNKESAKNPAVTTGLGTANQTSTPGYNFQQGAKDALLQTSDSKAYQAVVRGVNLLGRALGSGQ